MRVIGRAVWAWVFAEGGFCLALLALLLWAAHARGEWGRWA